MSELGEPLGVVLKGLIFQMGGLRPGGGGGILIEGAGWCTRS